MKGSVLQDLIAEQAAEEIERKGRWVILPLGSTEYHGPRGPFGTDSDVAWEVSKKVAEKIDALLLPVLHYGDSSFHKDFAGTIHIRTESLKYLILDVIASLNRHGAEKLLLLLGHWGNLDAALQAKEDAAANGMAIRVEIVRVFDPAVLDCLPMSRIFGEVAWSGHGGAAEVSCSLHVRPRARPCSADRVSRDSPPGAERDYSRLGWGGFPEAASAARGAATIETAAEAIVRHMNILDS